MYKIGVGFKKDRGFKFWLGRAWWGAVAGVSIFIIVLFVTMYFNHYGVFEWWWDATGRVWQIPVAGAILGLSFDFTIKTLRKIKKHLAGTRAFHRLHNTWSLSKPLYQVKEIKRG